MTQLKYSFQIEKEDRDRIRNLKKGFALAEELRIALRSILDKAKV